jgi:hypothetical protein
MGRPDERQGLPANELAVLIAAPWPGEVAMRNDVQAAAAVLRLRGFSGRDVWTLDEGVGRERVLGILAQAGRWAQAQSHAHLFLYVSGHGNVVGSTVEEALLALQLTAADVPSPEQTVRWDEIFAALAPRGDQSLTLLADT